METRIVKNGNSFALAIPKALVNCKVLDFGKRYKVTIEPLETEEAGEKPPLIYKGVSFIKDFAIA